jgi:purine-binding chemotaxis protein CheW
MTTISESIAMAREAAHTEGDDRRQFVTFALGEQLYCVDIMAVREIRVSNAITKLPGAPDYVRGVINLRGTIVPVCDLRIRFGQGQTELARSHAVVIVAINNRLTGLLVDDVCDIVTVGLNEIAPVPETDVNRRNPFFQGLITQSETMLIVIALDRLIDSIGPAAQMPERAIA